MEKDIEYRLAELLDIDMEAYEEYERQREIQFNELLEILGELDQDKYIAEFYKNQLEYQFRCMKLSERNLLVEAAKENSYQILKGKIEDTEYEEIDSTFKGCGLKENFLCLITVASELVLLSIKS